MLRPAGTPLKEVLEMKSVSIGAHGVAVDQYLDGYPSSCCVVLRDVEELPETLASALRQWFEVYAGNS